MKNKIHSFDLDKIQLNIQSPHVDMDEELNNYIISQIEKLGKLYSRIDRCEAMLLSRKNSKKDDCEIEVKLFVPGKVLYAKEQKSNFRLAAQSVFHDLYNQLHKFKGHLNNSSPEKHL